MHAYPLSWPAGWPRTDAGARPRGMFLKKQWVGVPGAADNVQRSRDLTIHDAVARVLAELKRLGVPDGEAIISTNVPVRLDGLPRGDARVPEDPGVAVYWRRDVDQSPKVMTIDRYARVSDNLAAVAATLEAMRAIERHGGARILDRAFTGFAALAAPPAARPWRDVLEVGAEVSNRAIVEAAYKRLRALRHPDRGGSAGAFQQVQEAYEQAGRELGS